MRLSPRPPICPFEQQGKAMTTFDDRERAFESLYARDQELQFKVTSRRNRLLGQWAAEKMGLSGEAADAYAKAVIRVDFEEAGDDDVVRKLLADLTAAKVDVDEAEIRRQIDHKAIDARRHFVEQQ